MSQTAKPASLGPTRQREWWHRYLEPQERRRVMADLAISRTPHWGFRFTVMLTLSVIVAVMGLAADSAAVVIGAMLLAPLMTPVLATAATMSMALFKKAFWSFTKVILASLWSIVLAYLLSTRIGNDHLADEVISRTSPDLKDLVVALAAGAAGSYATVRKDASASLPGVAVAVALVPPIATVGIMLEAGQMSDALGALLLYVTNLAAIILASVIVFVVTGFVPPRRLATTSLRLGAATVIAGAVVVAIAIPLFQASVTAAESSNQRSEALGIVRNWLGDERDLVPSIRFDEEAGRLFVELKGVDYPPDDADLRDDLQRSFGLVPSIQWIRTEKATTTTIAATTTSVITDEEVLQADIEGLVSRWLTESNVADSETQIDINFDDVPISVRVDVAGVGSEPRLIDLLTLFDNELDRTLAARVNWTERTVLAEGTTPPDPLEVRQGLMSDRLNDWASERSLTVRSFNFDGKKAEIELVGVEEPETTPLVLDLIEIANSDITVDVFFIERLRLETTTTQPEENTDPSVETTTTTEG